MNDDNELENKINKTKVNRFGGYCTPGLSFAPSRMAECMDKHLEFKDNHSRCPTINEFMEESKIVSRDLGIKILHRCKHDIKLNKDIMT